jgi:ribosome-associated protein
LEKIEDPLESVKNLSLLDSKELALHIAKLAWEKKARNLVILDVHEIAGYTDYFIICSGSNDRAVSSIAEHVVTCMKKHGIRPLGEEGIRYGQWALVDFSDVILHVFYRPVREFYALEKLWSDAPVLEIEKPAWDNDAGYSDEFYED